MGQPRTHRSSLLDKFRRRKDKAVLVSNSNGEPSTPQSSSGILVAGQEQQVQASPPGQRVSETTTHLVQVISSPSSLNEPTELLEQSADDISLSLWNDAYQRLRSERETTDLVKTYEKVLTGIYSNAMSLVKHTNEAPNSFDCAPRDRVSRMREMTLLSLKRAQAHENFHEGAKQVVEFIGGISKIVSSMLSAYPPAALAWSGVCAILPILVSPSIQLIAMRDGLFYVMEKMEWYLAVARMFLKDPKNLTRNMANLQELLQFKVGKLYSSLLEFEMKSVCACYESSPLVGVLKVMLSMDDWTERLTEIKTLESELRIDIKQIGNSSSMASLEQISKDTSNFPALLSEVMQLRSQDDEERHRLQEIERLERVAKFSNESTCPYVERMMAVPERVDGTCEWFQTHRKYLDWLNSRRNGLLLLSADPGCGKSVLSRFLIESVLPERAKNTNICYFFFKDSPDQNNVPTALCALIHQILTKTPELTDLPNVRAEIIQNGGALTSKEQVLWNIFTNLTSHDRGTDVICVLDALDECQKRDREPLVKRLQSMIEGIPPSGAESKTRGGTIKFLVTTRGYPEITLLFRDFQQDFIRLAGENKEEVDQIQTEIAIVTNHKLDKLAAERNFDDKRKEQIRQAMIDKGGEQRTYLWVKLVFEVLESNWRDQRTVWNRIINTLPTTVYDAYDKLLGSVCEADRERVMMLFRFMIAAFRPLPLKTAILLLDAIDFSESETDDLEELEWESEESFRRWVLGTCGIFITIYDQQLFFIHQTAKEFLQQAKPIQPGSPKALLTFRHSIPIREAHKAMVEGCIALRRYSGNGWKEESYKYFTELWAQHFRDSQQFTAKSGAFEVKDIEEKFWDGYLALWDDKEFIRGQELSRLLATYDEDTYNAPYTDEVRLAFIATYGHYRLLELELNKHTPEAMKLAPAAVPYLLSAGGAEKECTQLLLNHFPARPVVIVSEYNDFD